MITFPPTLLTGALDLAVLAILRNDERSPAEVHQLLTAAGLGGVRMGSVYGCLARNLELRTVDRAGRVYRLTDLGATVLADGTVQWDRFAATIRSLLERG